MNDLLHIIRELVVPIVSAACVLAVVAYFLVRTRFLALILQEKELALRDQLSLILPFTLFSVYGGLNAIPLVGSYVALNHVGQIVGGLLAGPIVGIGTGTILTVIRYSFGDYLALPASLTCMLVGLFAGLYHEWYRGWNRNNQLNARRAVLFTIGIEILGLGLSLLLPDFGRAEKMVLAGAIPTVFGNALGVGAFIFIMNTLVSERESLSVKKRIENELRFARDIQQNLLPRSFPPFAGPRKNVAVCGAWVQGRELGGEFYDLFFIDDHRFCFVIGEVSGKGVPTALMMSVIRSLLKTYAETGMDPDELLYRVNNELCRGNNTSLFVTLFYGVLDSRTGEIVYSNAGHNLPLIYSGGGQTAVVDQVAGMPMGTLEDRPYRQAVFVLNEGDVLVMYTRGLLASLNHQQEEQNEQPLVEMLDRENAVVPQILVDHVMQEAQRLTGGTEVARDMLLMAMICTPQEA